MAPTFIQFEKVVQNEKGLHARASAKLVSLVEAYDANCTIGANGKTVPGDSIMGILMLAAAKGCRIKVRIWGKERSLLEKAIIQLIDGRFDEKN